LLPRPPLPVPRPPLPIPLLFVPAVSLGDASFESPMGSRTSLAPQLDVANEASQAPSLMLIRFKFRS
jgi:hypothetical protein